MMKNIPSVKTFLCKIYPLRDEIFVAVLSILNVGHGRRFLLSIFR